MIATLEAVKRDGRGKNEARRLRAAGSLPAVVYGARLEDGERPAVPVGVDPKQVLRILRSDSGVNTIITLRLDGGETAVIVKEYQIDPVTHHLLHADFYQLSMDRMMTVTVPIVLKGEAKGVKLQGGMLDFVTREIEVECLPVNIPEHITLDVTDLVMHQSIRVRDLPQDPRWTALSESDTMLVHIVMPKAEESAAATAEVAAVPEPEVAKKGKGEEKEKEKEKEKE
jgi:large subunit ribosomal protein L25